MFIFNQAGEMEYQVRATGILSTSAIDEGVTVDFGTMVHPGVLAANHQHILSLRIDPNIGSYSHGNTVVQQEAQAMPLDEYNPHGNGYRVVKTELTTEGGHDLDWSKSRVFSVKNPHLSNPVNGLPISYKLMFPPVPPLLSHPSSFNARRAEFADHHLYVTKYRSDELYSGGKFTNQSESIPFTSVIPSGDELWQMHSRCALLTTILSPLGRGDTGIKSWIAKNQASTVDQDVVLWVQFGLNHIPRIEDFPVM